MGLNGKGTAGGRIDHYFALFNVHPIHILNSFMVSEHQLLGNMYFILWWLIQLAGARTVPLVGSSLADC